MIPVQGIMGLNFESAVIGVISGKLILAAGFIPMCSLARACSVFRFRQKPQPAPPSSFSMFNVHLNNTLVTHKIIKATINNNTSVKSTIITFLII